MITGSLRSGIPVSTGIRYMFYLACLLIGGAAASGSLITGIIGTALVVTVYTCLYLFIAILAMLMGAEFLLCTSTPGAAFRWMRMVLAGTICSMLCPDRNREVGKQDAHSQDKGNQPFPLFHIFYLLLGN